MRKKWFTLLVIAVTSMGLATTGCEINDGPIEKLGEQADEAVEDIGGTVEDATDN
jgi:hypothetical protein